VRQPDKYIVSEKPATPVEFIPQMKSWAHHNFYSAPLCSHCKRCTSYGNSVCPSVCHTPVLCQNDGT